MIPQVCHEVTARYVYPIDDTHLVLRLKTARGTVQKVSVVFGDRYQPYAKDDTHRMRKVGHDGQYDYWQSVLAFPKRRARYKFLLETETSRFWYGERGVAWTLDEAGYFHYPYIHRGEALRVPDWAVGSVVYQIFPDRFAKGDPTLDPPDVADWERDAPTPNNVFGGDLQGIIDHLDDLQALGVDVLYLTPIFLSPSNHKYDTTDYYRIDPHFGEEETLKTLVDAAHRRGIRVILDAVFNHSGYDFFAFRDVREKGMRSAYYDWFFVDASEPSDADESDREGQYETFANDVWNMPKLNTAHPEVARYFINVGRYWMERANIDGWRLDVANEVTPTFWRMFREEVKALKNDALIIGEVWHDALPWLSGDMFDGVMNYMFREAVVDFLGKHAIGANTFAERLMNIWMRYPEPIAHTLFNVLDSHDTERFITTAGGDETLLRMALFVMLTYPGMPMMYYGTEIALEGKDDPDCRRPYPWHRRDEKQALLDEIRTLTHLRKTHLPLRRGGFSVLYADDAQNVLVYARPYDGSDKHYVIIFNKSEHHAVWPLNPADLMSFLAKEDRMLVDQKGQSDRCTVSVLYGSEDVRSWHGRQLQTLLQKDGSLTIPPLENAIITLSV